MKSHLLSRRLLKASTFLCLGPLLVYGKGENGNSDFDVFDYIDPFIGTSDGGINPQAYSGIERTKN